jgi:hypothetical protein
MTVQAERSSGYRQTITINRAHFFFQHNDWIDFDAGSASAAAVIMHQ